MRLKSLPPDAFWWLKNNSAKRNKHPQDTAADIAAFHAARAAECNCPGCREEAAVSWGMYHQVDFKTLESYLRRGLSSKESSFFPEAAFLHGAEGLEGAWAAAELLRNQPWAVRAEDMRVGFLYRGAALLSNASGLDNCLVYIAPNWMESIFVVVVSDDETVVSPEAQGDSIKRNLYVASPRALVSGRVVAKKGTGKLVTSLSELPPRLRTVLSHCKTKPGLVLEEDLMSRSGGFRSRLLGALISGSPMRIEERMDPARRGEWGPEKYPQSPPAPPANMVVQVDNEGFQVGQGVGVEAPANFEVVPPDWNNFGVANANGVANVIPPNWQARVAKRPTEKKPLTPSLLGCRLAELGSRQAQGIFPLEKGSFSGHTITRVESLYVERGGARFWGDTLFVAKSTETGENGSEYIQYSMRPYGGGRHTPYAPAHTCVGFQQAVLSSAVLRAPAKLFDTCAQALWKVNQIFLPASASSPLLECLSEKDVATVLKLFRHSVYVGGRASFLAASFIDRLFAVGSASDGTTPYQRGRLMASCYSPVQAGDFLTEGPSGLDSEGGGRGSPFAGAEALVKTAPIPEESKALWPRSILVF